MVLDCSSATAGCGRALQILSAHGHSTDRSFLGVVVSVPATKTGENTNPQSDLFTGRASMARGVSAVESQRLLLGRRRQTAARSGGPGNRFHSIWRSQLRAGKCRAPPRETETEAVHRA